MKGAASCVTFEHIQAFVDQTRGQITIGEIPPTPQGLIPRFQRKSVG